MSECGFNLKYLSEAFRSDRGIVLAAVMQDGKALKYVSERLRNDHVTVLVAVRQDAKALKYASNRLKKDRIIVKAALKQIEMDIIALRKFLFHSGAVKKIINKCNFIYAYCCSEKFLKDFEFCLEFKNMISCSEQTLPSNFLRKETKGTKPLRLLLECCDLSPLFAHLDLSRCWDTRKRFK